MQTTFENQTTYSEGAIRTMTKMAYDLFQPQVSGRIYLVAFGLLVIGALGYSSGNPGFVSMLAVGCFALTSAEYASKAAAKRMISFFKGNFPVLKFTFRADNIFVVTPQDTGTVGYDILIRLAESREHFFLFNSQQSAYIVDKNGFVKGDEDEFRSFLQDKTGLVFESGVTLKQKIFASFHKNNKV